VTTEPAPIRPVRRRCAATGAVRPRSLMLRYAVAPDGTLIADAEGRRGGRGVWVTAERAAIETAARRGGFAKAARRAVRPGEDPAGAAEAALCAAALARLGRLARAGRLRGGDAAPAAVRIVAAGTDGTGVEGAVDCLTAQEIAAATGRAPPLALEDGPAARAFLAVARRLTGVRAGPKAARPTAGEADVNFRPAIRSAGQAGDR